MHGPTYIKFTNIFLDTILSMESLIQPMGVLILKNKQVYSRSVIIVICLPCVCQYFIDSKMDAKECGAGKKDVM